MIEQRHRFAQGDPHAPLRPPHLLALLLLGASLPPLHAQEQADEAEKPKSIPAAPDRAEGEGPFDRLILRGAILVDGTGAPPRGPVDIVIEGNRIVEIEGVGAPGLPIDPDKRPEAGSRATASSTSRECTCCPASSTCTATSAASSRARRPSTSSSSGWGTASPRSATRRPATASTGCWSTSGKSAANEITAPRIEAYPVFGQGREEPFTRPAEARRLGASHRRRRRRRHQVLRPPPRHPRGGPRRGRQAGSAHRLPPRPAGRHPGRRARHGALGPDHDGALVRPARGAVRRPHRPGLPGRLQLLRRAAPLRRGRAAVAPGGAARQRALEPGDGRAAGPRLHHRPDADHLRGQPRPDAGAARGVARRLHPAVAVGLLPAQPRRARLLLVLLDHRGRGRLEGELPALDGAFSTSTRTAAAG